MGKIKTVTVRGSSDDLIEIEGDISEELSHYARDDEDKGKLLAFSDGTVLRVHYDRDGIWRVARVCVGSAEFKKEEGNVEADTFDRVTLRGDLRWVVAGDALVKAKA